MSEAVAIAAALPLAPDRLVLLLALGFFFGLAFEEHYGGDAIRRPGGIRTFPILALLGALFWIIEPRHGIVFTAGLLVLGGLLLLYYRAWVQESARQEQGAELRGGLMVPACTILAYTLGPVAVLLPAWVAVAATVAGVVLLTARVALHRIARTIPQDDIVTAAKFLALAGVMLPLLPNTQVHPLLPITPYAAGLGVVAVSGLSYASYLAHRFSWISHGPLLAAMLGAVYSSTATTVALSKQLRSAPELRAVLRGGIILATGIMVLRVLVIVAIFNASLALGLLASLGLVALAAFATGGLLLRGHVHDPAMPTTPSGNPLALGAALLFAILLVVMATASFYATSRFGSTGLYVLAALSGLADVDPFVLGMAKTAVPDPAAAGGIAMNVAATAISFTVAANNALKGAYALVFAGRREGMVPAGLLLGMALLGAVLAPLARA
ncbi:MAG: DUF4010 domain-containing protein [Alphaproteobacteria bacterium]|nr:DUF4010 domain-containing protein [Alphaproteobacteria bacterium]